MAGKSKSNRKSPGAPLTLVHGAGKPDPRALTLADITVTWTDHLVQRSATGSILARLLTRAAHLDGNANLLGSDVATGTGPSLLRGLGEIMYPDAGSPTAEIDADRRWFLNWALGQLAAEQQADLMAVDAGAKFTVTVLRK